MLGWKANSRATSSVLKHKLVFKIRVLQPIIEICESALQMTNFIFVFKLTGTALKTSVLWILTFRLYKEEQTETSLPRNPLLRYLMAYNLWIS